MPLSRPGSLRTSNWGGSKSSISALLEASSSSSFLFVFGNFINGPAKLPSILTKCLNESLSFDTEVVAFARSRNFFISTFEIPCFSIAAHFNFALVKDAGESFFDGRQIGLAGHSAGRAFFKLAKLPQTY